MMDRRRFLLVSAGVAAVPALHLSGVRAQDASPVPEAVEEDIAARLGTGDTMALKLLLKRLIANSDPGMPDLWSPR